MRRRDFIGLLGGATAAWPIAAQAQQQAMPVVGYLDQGAGDGRQLIIAAFFSSAIGAKQNCYKRS